MSESEAETGGLFINAQNCILMRAILQAISYTQPLTPINIDNTIATGFVQNITHLQRSKSWDMHHYWLPDKETHENILVY